MSETWSILVHGGAKTIPPEQEAAHRAGCLAAVMAAGAVLAAGGSAVDACVRAIRVLEDDPTFNAGSGAVRNRNGDVELDAALMDGSTLAVGAVAGLRAARNPIEVARSLLADSAVFLIGEGADCYAAEMGLASAPSLTASAPGEACNTVGCVALDARGDMAAGTSTGGLEGVRPGRVGDSPIPGCGLAAENGRGAVSFSGDGESILRLTLAARVMHDLEEAAACVSAARAIEQLPRVGGEAGCIVLDAHGRPGVAHNSANFAFAFAASTVAARAYVHHDEFKYDR